MVIEIVVVYFVVNIFIEFFYCGFGEWFKGLFDD